MAWTIQGHRNNDEDRVFINVGIGNGTSWKVTQALVDTGATHTCISDKFSALSGLAPLGQKLQIQAASSSVMGELADATIRFFYEENKKVVYYDFETRIVIIHNMSLDVVLGMATLSYFDLQFRTDKSFTMSI